MKLSRCPRCGKGKLFRGFITISDHCSECGLPLKQHEQGDGPASVSILIVGALVGVFATVVEVKYEPSFWVHAALWIPFIIIGSLVCLRYIKAAMLQLQYKTKPEDF